ncbi:MAG: sugar transferase [Anaerolineae bacterium]|nr:sugar transferase [Anaerolineae bacterium]
MQTQLDYSDHEIRQAEVLERPAISERLKRLIDVTLASVVLGILSPLLLLAALAIRLTSKGPVLVGEQRVRRRLARGASPLIERVETFTMYRLRTTYETDDSEIVRLADKRLTRVGRWLQKISLDEIPELINVVRGDMSLVGPRPIPTYVLERNIAPEYERRFDTKPGVTGLWQVTRRHIGTIEEMAETDILYVQNRSLWLDLKILIVSPRAILWRSSIQHWIDQSSIKVRENLIYNLIKRVMDLVLASIGLVVLSPLLLLIAILIKLDSPGPAMFTQVRAGKRVLLASQKGPMLLTTNFKIYKFRTMHNDQKRNDALHKEWVQNWVDGKLNAGKSANEVVKPKRDPRVTRIGRILRATSLDELPQLINVVKGDMSLVGPRPVPVYEVESYEEWHYARLDATPGMTGYWQIKLRGRGTLDQMVELDLEYLKKRSIWSDLKIIFLTVPAVVIGRGAK